MRELIKRKDGPTMHTIAFTCTFCGYKWSDTYPVQMDEGINVNGCRRCTVPVTAQRGTQIRYAAPDRAPADAIYADHHLKRGEVYTVAWIMQWQHGARVQFEETGEYKTFNLRLFVPVSFNRE
jgi:hypothetical protein